MSFTDDKELRFPEIPRVPEIPYSEEQKKKLALAHAEALSSSVQSYIFEARNSKMNATRFTLD